MLAKRMYGLRSRASSRLRRPLSRCVSRRLAQPGIYGGSSFYAPSTETVGASLLAKRSHGLVREQARAYGRWPGREIEPDLHKAASLSGIEGSAYMAPGMAPEGGKSGRTAARPGCPGALSLWLLSLCAGRRSAGKEKVTRPGAEKTEVSAQSVVALMREVQVVQNVSCPHTAARGRPSCMARPAANPQEASCRRPWLRRSFASKLAPMA